MSAFGGIGARPARPAVGGGVSGRGTTCLAATFAGSLARGAVHISLCKLMSRELQQRYSGAIRHVLESCPNMCTKRGEASPEAAQPERSTLGHLSNLCVEKGLATAINCLRLRRQAGVEATLRLGPVANREAVAIIEAAKADFGGHLVYEGPLYGRAKYELCYEAISVSLFPTKNGAQGIVNLEALAAGTPVVAYGRCCTPRDIGGSGGLSVQTGASFEETALPQLLKRAKDPAALGRASTMARRRFARLQRVRHLRNLIAR